MIRLDKVVLGHVMAVTATEVKHLMALAENRRTLAYDGRGRIDEFAVALQESPSAGRIGLLNNLCLMGLVEPTRKDDNDAFLITEAGCLVLRHMQEMQTLIRR